MEGAKAIRKHCPDILITDIRMPNADGLTMLSGIRSEFPKMQITVLTGFRDFTYAQKAIKIGVTRFLVKPSKMNEIKEALEVMIANLAEQGNDGLNNDKEDDTSEAANNFVVRQALSYIEEHYSEKVSLGKVADECYVSQWHLSKLLNKHTGQNFYDILNGIRIREAKKLLSDPSMRISEISEIVGYTDPAHFSRIFKKLEGVSANEYRNFNCIVNK